MTPPIPPGERLSEAEREALAALVAAMPSAHILRELSRDDGVLTRKYPVTMMDGTMLALHELAARLLATPSDSGGEGLADALDRIGYTAVFNAIADAVRPIDAGVNGISVEKFIASLRKREAATPPTAATPTKPPSEHHPDCLRFTLEDCTCPAVAATPSAGDAVAHLRELVAFGKRVDAAPYDGVMHVEFRSACLRFLGYHAMPLIEEVEALRDDLTRPQGAATLAVDDAMVERANAAVRDYAMHPRNILLAATDSKAYHAGLMRAALTAALHPSQAGGG